MQIPRKILKAWKLTIEDIGILAVAVGSGVNYRTMKKTIESGACKDTVFVKVCAFMEKRKLVVKKLIQTEADAD